MLEEGYAWVFTAFCQKDFCRDWKEKVKQVKNEKKGALAQKAYYATLDMEKN